MFAKTEEVLKFYDPTRNYTTTFSEQTKEDLRDYIENPYSNASQLRSISRYLMFHSQVYKKIIWDNAAMIDTQYRQIIPNYDFTKRNQNDQKAEKSFYETAKMLDLMNLPSEMLKVYLECWTVDVFYGIYYFFKDQGGFLFPLDPDYCKIIGVYPTGDFAFALDCSWLRTYEDELELWGEPFVSMYKAYTKDTQGMRWQEVPAEYACCMKLDLVNQEYAIPPYLPIFNSLLDLEDLKGIQAIQAAEQIYKMFVFKVPLQSNSSRINDFAIDPQIVAKYFERAKQIMPDDYVGAIMSPVDIDTLQFNEDAASDVNKVEDAAKNVMKSAGHTLFGIESGQTAIDAQLKAFEDFALSSLLPQTQAWVNRQLLCRLANPSKVKFLEVTKYSRKEFKESIMKDLNYGLPMLNVMGALNGFSEVELLSLAKLHEAMGLRTKYYPYATAATQGAHNIDSVEGKENGRPKGEPTDASEASADKRDARG